MRASPEPEPPWLGWSGALLVVVAVVSLLLLSNLLARS